MFLHLGGDFVVYVNDIVSILDVESTLHSKHSKNFIKKCEDEGVIIKVTEDDIRSFIIVEESPKNKKIKKRNTKLNVYYSPISAATLQKRMELINQNLL